VKIITGLLLCVLLFSCHSTRELTKETSREIRSDTSAYKETIKLDTLKAPKETATLAIPFHVLRDTLWSDFETTSGRAKVKVRLLHDTLYAGAECDSLEKVIATKDKELYQFRHEQTEQQTTSKQVIIQLPLWFRLALIGGLVLLVLLIAIHIYNLFNPTSWAGKISSIIQKMKE
jgi:hypothetical protein